MRPPVKWDLLQNPPLSLALPASLSLIYTTDTDKVQHGYGRCCPRLCFYNSGHVSFFLRFFLLVAKTYLNPGTKWIVKTQLSLGTEITITLQPVDS